jgi:hypothetical protein
MVFRLNLGRILIKKYRFLAVLSIQSLALRNSDSLLSEGKSRAFDKKKIFFPKSGFS